MYDSKRDNKRKLDAAKAQMLADCSGVKTETAVVLTSHKHVKQQRKDEDGGEAGAGQERRAPKR